MQSLHQVQGQEPGQVMGTDSLNNSIANYLLCFKKSDKSNISPGFIIYAHFFQIIILNLGFTHY